MSTARVGVLDDHARRDLELAQEPPCRVEVEQVVVGELLALVLTHHREQVHAGAHLLVVRGALMRVLAVGQVGDLLVRPDEQGREVVGALGEPAGDRRVVAGGVGERVARKRLARLDRERAAGRLQLGEHAVVGLRLDDDRRERVVLRGRANHRRPADVDVLDDLGVGHAAPGGGALEGVEVDAHEIDGLDAVLRERGDVLGI
jgi:hypothetical protein